MALFLLTLHLIQQHIYRYLLKTTRIRKKESVVREDLDPRLVERLKLVEKQDYEGEPLQKADYIALLCVGLIIPFTLMLWGWLA